MKGAKHMSFRRFLISALATVFLVSTFTSRVHGNSSRNIDPADLKNIMLVKDIKPGMKGYGKTVFRGTKIETFQAEVLGIMRKVNMGTDLILVRLSGGPITERGANLIEGMSGSPIYINGKIIGAFAYGGIFGKEPIGMVTPIEYMHDAWDPSLPTKPSTFYPFSVTNLSKPVVVNGRTYTKAAIDDGSGQTLVNDGNTLVLRPLATPLMVSGMSPRIMAKLEEVLRPFNIRAIAGPGKPVNHADIKASLEPGAAVGISFVTGDLDLTGVGTLTYRRGNKVLALGHPMFGLGAVDAGLTTAYVYDVFPSYMISSKIAGPLTLVGRIGQDRPWSVGGEIGKLPEMIPVVVHIRSESPKQERTFRVKVMSHPMITTLFAPLAVSEGILEVIGSPADTTARVKTCVVAEEVGTITRENVFFDSMAIESTATTELSQIMRMLQFNPFYPVGIKSIEIWVELTPNHQTAKLERVFIRQSKYKPGDTVEIGAVLRPFKGERVTKIIKINLPENMPNGSATIQVSGGAMSAAMSGGSMADMGSESDISMMSPMAEPPMMASPSVENLQQLIKKYLERDKNNDLVAKIILPKPIPAVSGEKFPDLPPSIAALMKTTKATSLASERNEIKFVVPMEWVISGNQRLTITVQAEDNREKKTASPTTVSQPSEEESEADEEDTGEKETDTSEGQSESLYMNTLSIQYDDMPAPPTTTAKPYDGNNPEKATRDLPPSSTQNQSKPATSSITPAVDEKPVGKLPKTWTQTTRAEFLTGKMTDVVATTGDLLTVAGSVRHLCDLEETLAWSVIPDGKGGLYVGTGHRGIIYKLYGDGKISVVYDSPELEVNSLALDTAGNLYAGTSPNGIIYKISADGTPSLLYDADEKYVTALTLDSKGNLYAATGDRCKVYRITPDGKAEVVLNTSEMHALSLAVDTQDNLYIGAGLNGLIYKVTPDGSASVWYDASEESVTALAIDKKGILYAGTSPKGVIYKLVPGSTPKVIYDKAGQGITAMCSDANGNVYAVNSTSVFKILPDDTVCTLANDRDVQFISLALTDSKLYASTGNMAEICEVPTSGISEATYESPTHDCGQISNWGIIEWTANVPDGAELRVQTRTGNSAQPDSTWSPWSPPYTKSGEKIISPPARYIQYLLTIKPGSANTNVVVKDVSIVYLPKNQPPKVSFTSPKGGEKWARKKTIKWTGSDPDKDTLMYELFYSPDGGATWQPLNEKITSVPPTGAQEEPSEEEPMEEEVTTDSEKNAFTSEDKAQVIAAIAAKLENYDKISSDMKEQIMKNAISESQDLSTDARSSWKDESPNEISPSKNGNNSTKQTTYAWDTTQVKDGIYVLKVIASDRASNAADALSAEAISDPIIVCNKSPRVTVFKKSIVVQTDKRIRIEGIAYQDLVGIAGVQYRVGASGDWMPAGASDGIFDTPTEPFVILTEPMSKGPYTIEIKAIDQAGNSATTKANAIVN